MNQTTVTKVIVMIWQLRFEPVHVFDCVWRCDTPEVKEPLQETSGSLSSPVVDELGHEFEDGRGACWVVVPELDGSLQNGHVGWISAGLRSGTFSDRLWWIINIVTVQRAVRSLTVSRLKGYIQSNSIMKLVLALKANAIPRRSRTKPTSVLYRKQEKKKKTTGLTNIMKCTKY